ncbi:FecR family protein [Maribacter sp. Asnod1-A12]|uniref:FecR family protein n=1 Tax=Maribacter sp. Asnod1-A12 TaxID=3160576 RepID=UPI00386F726F
MKKNQLNDNLTNFDKQSLRDRIIKSADQAKAKKRNQRILMAAASIVLLIGASIFFQSESETTIENFVESSPNLDVKKAEGVTLILGSGDNLNLDGNSTTVHYSNTGEEVVLSTGETVNQKSTQDNRPLYNTILVPFGKRTDLKLSDGSMVWLNSGSKLVYPAVFNGKTREVYLEGEAIFEVTHNPNKPFKVLSANQEIEVLGTVFNVSSYKEDALNFTVLKSGSVEINYNDKNIESIKIKPGTLASYNSNSKKALTQKVNVNDYFSWRDGFLNFKNDDLKFIMTKLSRYYDVEIVIDENGLAEQTFSGNLDLKDNVEKIISLIAETSNFKVTYKEGIIQLNNSN